MAQVGNKSGVRVDTSHMSVMMRRKKILDDLSLSFVSPNIYGIVGPNGSGKTVFLKAMLGFIRLVSGSVTMNEVPIDPRRAFPISVGAIIEHPGFMNDMSGHDNLLALGQIRSQLDDEAIHAVMTRVGLPDDKKPVATYSLGMIQRLGIAQAIMEDQEFIVLDEPTNALDREGVVFLTELLKELRDQGKLVLIATHDLLWLQSLADQIFELSNGKLQQVEDVV